MTFESYQDERADKRSKCSALAVDNKALSTLFSFHMGSKCNKKTGPLLILITICIDILGIVINADDVTQITTKTTNRQVGFSSNFFFNFGI